MIFETERLLVRKLSMADLKDSHKLQSNPLVLQYATGEIKSFVENKKELTRLISRYNTSFNDFWIYAIERKIDSQFIETIALIKNEKDDEK